MYLLYDHFILFGSICVFPEAPPHGFQGITPCRVPWLPAPCGPMLFTSWAARMERMRWWHSARCWEDWKSDGRWPWGCCAIRRSEVGLKANRFWTNQTLGKNDDKSIDFTFHIFLNHLTLVNSIFNHHFLHSHSIYNKLVSCVEIAISSLFHHRCPDGRLGPRRGLHRSALGVAAAAWRQALDVLRGIQLEPWPYQGDGGWSMVKY